MKVFMRSRTGDFDAFGDFDNGRIIVKKGSKIRLQYSENFRRAHKSVEYRNDPSYVNDKGIVLKDCIFKSPSTAAQFVNGLSTNGYLFWHVDSKTNLKKWLEQERNK